MEKKNKKPKKALFRNMKEGSYFYVKNTGSDKDTHPFIVARYEKYVWYPGTKKEVTKYFVCFPSQYENMDCEADEFDVSLYLGMVQPPALLS